MVLALTACVARDALVVNADAASAPVLADFVSLLDDTRGIPIDVVGHLDCEECYEVSAANGGWIVHGGLPLGVQYGLADVLERNGCGFFHPYATRTPEEFTRPDDLDPVRHNPNAAQIAGFPVLNLSFRGAVPTIEV